MWARYECRSGFDESGPRLMDRHQPAASELAFGLLCATRLRRDCGNIGRAEYALEAPPRIREANRRDADWRTEETNERARRRAARR